MILVVCKLLLFFFFIALHENHLFIHIILFFFSNYLYKCKLIFEMKKETNEEENKPTQAGPQAYTFFYTCVTL